VNTGWFTGGMNILTNEFRKVAAESVSVAKDTLKIETADGRTVESPLGWFPRLLHGIAKERSHWRLIGGGEGIHCVVYQTNHCPCRKSFLPP
jgi:hypothetical protein